MHGDVPDRAALARAHEGARSASCLADDGAAAAACHVLEPVARIARADLLVGIHDDGNRKPLKILGAGVLQGMKDRDHARLAVGAPRPAQTIALAPKRVGPGRPVGKDRIKVGVEHDVVGLGLRLVGGKKPLARLSPTSTRCAAKPIDSKCRFMICATRVTPSTLALPQSMRTTSSRSLQ